MFDWRSEFFEALEDNLDPEDEQKINLKRNIKNKVVINPQMEEKQADIDNRIEEAKLRAEINQMESTIEVDPLKHAVEKAVQQLYVKSVPVKEDNSVSTSLKNRIASIREAAREPYAIGMAAAMKSTGDQPPLEKSTIKKAHKIAKKIIQQEAAEDRLRDERQMRGGVAGNVDYRRPAPDRVGPKKPPATPEQRAAALAAVRKSVTDKYGKGALM